MPRRRGRSARQESGTNAAAAIVRGALAGTAATVPMSAAMLLLNRSVDPARRATLPPRDITREAAEAAGRALPRLHLEEHAHHRRQLTVMTVLAHFGYGAAAGAAYGALAGRSPGRRGPLEGAVYGLGVWSLSYLGWLPATGLFPPPQGKPPYLSALMAGAHLVWGAALGSLFEGGEERPRAARAPRPSVPSRQGTRPRRGTRRQPRLAARASSAT